MSPVARAEIAQQMKDTAAGVLLGVDETTVRLQLLGLALDPNFAAIERAVQSRAADLPTTDRETVQGYIANAIERRLLTGPDPITLAELNRDPAAWADAFARACVPSGITELRRHRDRAAKETQRAMATKTPTYWPSAEAQMFAEREDRIADDWLERIAAAPQWQRESLLAHALLDLHELPAPWFASADDRRWVSGLLATEAGADALHDSLQSPAPQEVDPRLTNLWRNYSAEHVASLGVRSSEVLVSIVKGIATMPPRPTEGERVLVRSHAKADVARRGWSKLVMAAEKSWAAEFFSSRVAGDNHDRRSDEVAEKERSAAASHWREVATQIVSFTGRPDCCSDLNGVQHWLDGHLEAVRARR